ncbi:hypothetical protein AHiyo4_07750 [Arthrobacter sp. Hiyo4]|nr:hypothetical protein AHiyo4_07750 [Arthrobacter sp. Hiyo4]
MGAEIKRIRQKNGMSAQDVADATRALGEEVPRQVIANLESGRRANFSIAELVLCARALQCSPVELLYPPADLNSPVEYLPGQNWRTLDAYMDFAALPPLHKDRWRDDEGHTAATRTYSIFIQIENVDEEAEDLARELQEAGSDEALSNQLKSALVRSIIMRRVIPAGHAFPAPKVALQILWRENFTKAEFLMLAGDAFGVDVKGGFKQ